MSDEMRASIVDALEVNVGRANGLWNDEISSTIAQPLNARRAHGKTFVASNIGSITFFLKIRNNINAIVFLNHTMSWVY